MIQMEVIEVVDSACCRCNTPILAQVVPERIQLILKEKETKEENQYKAIEWCPNCNEFHVMEEIPNPETRRIVEKVKVGHNQMDIDFCNDCTALEHYTGRAKIKELINEELTANGEIKMKEFCSKNNLKPEVVNEICEELGLDNIESDFD